MNAELSPSPDILHELEQLGRAPATDCESAANTDPSLEERKALIFRNNLESRRGATGADHDPTGTINPSALSGA
jgi:hypothetical protein